MTILEQVVDSSRKAPRYKTLVLGRVRQFIEFAGDDPSNWTAATVERWRDHLIETQGIKVKSANVYLNALRFASKRYARIADGVDFAAPAETLTGILLEDAPTNSKKGGALTQAECKRLLATCDQTPPGLRDRAMVLTMLHVAFRRQEICVLQLENIEATDAGANLSVIVKGRRWHTVEIGGEGWIALQTWIAWLTQIGVSQGAVFRRLRPYVGPEGWRTGAGLSGDGLYKILRKRAEVARVHDFHPHRFRHTFVTLAREAGWAEWQIRKVTGHRSGAGSSPMVDHYSHDRMGPLGVAFPTFEE